MEKVTSLYGQNLTEELDSSESLANQSNASIALTPLSKLGADSQLKQSEETADVDNDQSNVCDDKKALKLRKASQFLKQVKLMYTHSYL